MDARMRFAHHLKVVTDHLDMAVHGPLEDLSYLQSWSFRSLTVDMNPTVFLDHCIAEGLQFDNEKFDVS